MPNFSEDWRTANVLLNQFYADVLFALAEHSRSKSATAQGAPAILKRVGKEWGLGAADAMVLPRLTRQQLQGKHLAPGDGVDNSTGA